MKKRKFYAINLQELENRITSFLYARQGRIPEQKKIIILTTYNPKRVSYSCELTYRELLIKSKFFIHVDPKSLKENIRQLLKQTGWKEIDLEFKQDPVTRLWIGRLSYLIRQEGE